MWSGKQAILLKNVSSLSRVSHEAWSDSVSSQAIYSFRRDLLGLVILGACAWFGSTARRTTNSGGADVAPTNCDVLPNILEPGESSMGFTHT